MASLKIRLLDYKQNNEGRHPIVLQVIKDRKRKLLYLGYYAYAKEWDHKENLPNSKHPNSARLKVVIRKKLNVAERAILDFDDRDKPYTAQDVIDEVAERKDSSTFREFTELTIAKFKRLGNYGNARVYQNTLNVFNASLDEAEIYFYQIDYKCIQGFEEYLIEKESKINTISNHLRTLRAIYNRAIKEGITREEYYPFKNYKIKSEKTQKRAISKDDINKIRDLDLKDRPDLIMARDFFLFSFYNRGMSFIDIALLKVKNIQKDHINYTRKKTGQHFSIKISDLSEMIIKQYSDLQDPDSYVFPIIKRKGYEDLDYRNAMRLMNKKLKKIGEKVDISAPLTTYVSRHSWATIGKRSGIPIAVISEGLGHETEETTQIYLDNFENEVLDDANEKIIR